MVMCVQCKCDMVETSSLWHMHPSIMANEHKRTHDIGGYSLRPDENQRLWYYVNANGCQIGPCRARDLSQGIIDGSLSTASMVRLGPSSWITLEDAMDHDDGIWSSIERIKNEMDGVGSPPPRATLFWSYIDKGGHEQGPFDTETMIVWRHAGCFPEATTLVRVWPHGWVAANLVSHLFPRCCSQEENLGDWQRVD